VDGVLPEPLGNRHPTIAPFQACKASDNYFVIGCGNDSLWKKLCEAIGRMDLLENKSFTTNDLRTQNLSHLITELDKTICTKTAAEWVEIIDGAGVPCGPINTIDKLFTDSQILARNMVVNVEDEKAGSIKIAGNPIKMTFLEDKHDRNPAPAIGEHNADVLSEMLGLTKKEIDDLKANGVI